MDSVNIVDNWITNMTCIHFGNGKHMNNTKGPHFGIFQSKGPYLDPRRGQGQQRNSTIGRLNLIVGNHVIQLHVNYNGSTLQQILWGIKKIQNEMFTCSKMVKVASKVKIVVNE